MASEVSSTQLRIYEPVSQFYYIGSKLKPNHVLEIQGGKFDTRSYIVASENRGPDAHHQQWYFENAGDGYVYIISRYNGLVFDIKNASHKASAYVHTFSRNAPPRPVACQKWKIEENGFIKSQLNGQFLSIKHSSTKPGAYVIMDHKKEDCQNSQRWIFEPCGTDDSHKSSLATCLEGRDYTVDELGGQKVVYQVAAKSSATQFEKRVAETVHVCHTEP